MPCNSGAGSHTLKTSKVPSSKTIAGTPSNWAAPILICKFGFRHAGQNARKLLEHAAKRRDERQQNQDAHRDLARRQIRR